MNLPKPKPGYKWEKTIYQQHEEIPKDWDFVSISETGKIIGGGTPNTTELEYWEDGNISWYTPEELTKLGSNFVKDSKRKITQKGLDKSSAKILQKGTILITTRATVGNCAISDNKVTTNQGFQNLEVNKNHNNLFLMYSIRYNKRRLLQYAQGTTFLEISKTNFGKIKIPCPNNVQEEEKIGLILSNIDELIQKQHEVIAQTQKLMKGQMQKLFTKGIRNRKPKEVEGLFHQTENIPEEWDYGKLENLTSEKSAIKMGPFGSSLKKEELVKNGILTLWIENIVNNEFTLDYKQYITKEKFEELRGFEVKPDDILITMMGTVGRVAIVPKDIGTAIITSHLLKIRLDQKKCLPKFLYYFLQSYFIHRQLLRESRGIVMSGLNTEIIKSLLIKVPKLPEQQKIVSILSNLDLLIQQEKQYKEKLEKIKRGLMQQLLTGQKRVKV